jgi:methionine sulfoxide reductase heme-binding subunit
MNRKLARIIASKWFAAPLAAIPFFFLAWTYQKAVDSMDDPTAPQEANDSSANDEIEDDGFSFTVTDEEFLEATLSPEEVPESTLAEANLNALLTEETGSIAISFFIITLCLTPLRRLFPGVILVSALNRHRRLLGLACFFYACLHFTLYFDDGLQRLIAEWSILYVQAGLAAFSVLCIMAITSNDWAVRKLGGRRWKKVHRLVYLLIPILFYHKGWAGKGGFGSGEDKVVETLIWFSPLFALQLLRIFLYLRKRSTVSSVPSQGT